MSHTFNEFQRELRARGIRENNAYMFTLVYERLIETENQLGQAMQVVEALANSMKGFVELNEATERKLKMVMRAGRPDGVEVHSVAWDDKDH